MVIVMVHAKDDTAALILMVIGLGVIFLGRFYGVMDFFNVNRIGHWLKDISYESGLSHERRVFYNHPMDIAKTKDISHFWEEVCKALQSLEFDLAELALVDQPGTSSNSHFTWYRNGAKAEDLLEATGLLKLEQPLMGSDCTTEYYGTLFLVKDAREKGISHYALKRLEHLRRAMGSKLEDLHQGKLPTIQRTDNSVLPWRNKTNYQFLVLSFE